MDISGASKNRGGKVHQWDCHNGGNQKWKIVPRGGEWNSFVVQHSNKCLDLAQGKKNNGAQFHQWDYNAKNSNQLFQVIGVN